MRLDVVASGVGLLSLGVGVVLWSAGSRIGAGLLVTCGLLLAGVAIGIRVDSALPNAHRNPLVLWAIMLVAGGLIALNLPAPILVCVTDGAPCAPWWPDALPGVMLIGLGLWCAALVPWIRATPVGCAAGAVVLGSTLVMYAGETDVRTLLAVLAGIGLLGFMALWCLGHTLLLLVRGAPPRWTWHGAPLDGAG